MTKYWTKTTYWTGKDGNLSTVIPTAPEAPPPTSTADPNSLGELMRYAIFLLGDPLPHDPKELVKTDERAET